MMMVKTMMESSYVNGLSSTLKIQYTHEHIIIQIRKKNKSNEIQDKQQVKEEDVQEEEETESKLSKSSKNRWESLESTFKEDDDEDEKEDEEDVQEDAMDVQDDGDNIVLREKDSVISTPLNNNVRFEDYDDDAAFIDLLQSEKLMKCCIEHRLRSTTSVVVSPKEKA